MVAVLESQHSRHQRWVLGVFSALFYETWATCDEVLRPDTQYWRKIERGSGFLLLLNVFGFLHIDSDAGWGCVEKSVQVTLKQNLILVAIILAVVLCMLCARWNLWWCVCSYILSSKKTLTLSVVGWSSVIYNQHIRQAAHNQVSIWWTQQQQPHYSVCLQMSLELCSLQIGKLGNLEILDPCR